MPLLNSTHLYSADYDDQSMQLTVRFQAGGTYTYYNVPKDVYDSLLAAPSAHEYFGVFVKPHFQVERTGD